MILLQMYTKTSVKLLEHLFLGEMDWPSCAYLARLVEYASFLIPYTRCHMAEDGIKPVPDRWEIAESGKRNASYDNLILDHNPHTKAKTGYSLKSSPPHLGTKKCHRDLDVNFSN